MLRLTELGSTLDVRVYLKQVLRIRLAMSVLDFIKYYLHNTQAYD